MTVVVAGHICVDLTPSLSGVPPIIEGSLATVGAMAVQLGGSVANSARTFRHLGMDCRVSARVGSDALGDLARRLLDAEGMDPSALEADTAAATSYSLVFEAPGRDRSFWHHAGANDTFVGSDLDLAGVRALHLGYPSLLGALRRDAGSALAELFQRASAAKVLTSLDLAVVDPSSPAAQTDWGALLSNVLPYTDVVSPSIEDLRSIADSADGSWRLGAAADLAEALVDRGASIALVSSGSQGVHVAAAGMTTLRERGMIGAAWANAREYRAAETIAAVDSTNGAGDATSAGFLAAILRGAGPGAATEAAVAAGAAAVGGKLRFIARGEGED